MNKKTRHILGLSGGKDSSTLAKFGTKSLNAYDLH